MRSSLAVAVMLVACGGGGEQPPPDSLEPDAAPDPFNAVVPCDEEWGEGGQCEKACEFFPENLPYPDCKVASPMGGLKARCSVYGLPHNFNGAQGCCIADRQRDPFMVFWEPCLVE